MIELKDINFKYNGSSERNGLSNINLTVKQGEVILLCGESGCGKTTLTRLLNGLIPNYYEGQLSGEIMIDGQMTKDFPLYKTAKMVGSVFQNPRSQFFTVDTTSELAFGCENQGLPEVEIVERIKKTVGRFKIKKLMGRSIFKLSGGEKQKVACASVSVQEPKIYVLDEPSSNLDMGAIEDLKRVLQLWKASGSTIIIAEHRLHYLKEIADRILYMSGGEIVKEYTSNKLAGISTKELANLGLRVFSLNNIKDLKIDSTNTIGNEKLYVQNLCFSYKRSKKILEIPKLAIAQKGITAIVGRNGAGKSTFARCLCGLEKKCGTISLNEVSLIQINELKIAILLCRM